MTSKSEIFLNRKCIIVDIIGKLCPENAIGAEIGVYEGNLSKALLRECSIDHLYLIDPYIGGYADFAPSVDCKQVEMDKRFRRVRDSLAKDYPKRSTLIRKKSEDACSDVPDNLDFIYIDGDHKYEFVMKDLQMWVPKVRSGGLIIGDDWHRKFPGVIRAVRKYCKNNNTLNPPCSSYAKYRFSKPHVNAPGSGKSVVNKCHHTWWSTKNAL